MSLAKLRIGFLILLYIHHLVVWVLLSTVKIAHLNLDEKEIEFLHMGKKVGYRFLTLWNFFHQTLYIFIALLLEVLPHLKLKNGEYLIRRISKFNWYNFTSFVFPWTLVIPAVFWPIFMADRELIYPSVLDKINPTWTNHGVHTNILYLLLVEMMFSTQRPPKLRSALIGVTNYALIYAIVLFYTYFYDGIWLYGFFDVMTMPQRILSLLTIYAFVLMFVCTGVSIQNWKFSKKRSVSKSF